MEFDQNKKTFRYEITSIFNGLIQLLYGIAIYRTQPHTQAHTRTHISMNIEMCTVHKTSLMCLISHVWLQSEIGWMDERCQSSIKMKWNHSNNVTQLSVFLRLSHMQWFFYVNSYFVLQMPIVIVFQSANIHLFLILVQRTPHVVIYWNSMLYCALCSTCAYIVYVPRTQWVLPIDENLIWNWKKTCQFSQYFVTLNFHL